MIPQRSEQLLTAKEKTWKDDHFFIQAHIIENPADLDKDNDYPGGWNISVPSELPAVVLNPKVRDQYTDAKDLPVNKDVQSNGEPINRYGTRNSMLAGTAYVSVTTQDNKTPRYYTLRRDAGAPIAAGFLTTASGFAGEHPMETIVKEANEECGVYFVNRQDYTLKRVAFADVVKTELRRRPVGAPELYTEVSTEYTIGNTLDQAEWKKNFDKQKTDITKQIDKNYPQFSDIDLDKTEPVLANKIDSKLYKKIGMSYDVSDSFMDREFGTFDAFAFYQPEFNVLNLGLIYHIDLPCKDEDLIIIDNESFGREARLMTVPQLDKEERKLSFLAELLEKQSALIKEAEQKNIEVLQPL